MSDYLPPTDDVRHDYAWAGEEAFSRRSRWFDRWLADIEAKAEQRGYERGCSETASEVERLRFAAEEVNRIALPAIQVALAVRGEVE